MQTDNSGYAFPAMTASVSVSAAAVRTAAVAANPSSHRLPANPRAVVNQLNLPCCVSTALGAAMEAMNPQWPSLAPLFHYYVTRFQNHGADSDGFLFLIDALFTLTRDGISRKTLHPYPYTEDGASTKPSSEAFTDGAQRALGRRAARLRFRQSEGPSRVVWIREQLLQNCPVILGIQLPAAYPNFLNTQFEWRDPNLPRSLSGHCVFAFGYDDSRNAFQIQDSRGETEFDRGCWWMGYSIVDSTNVKEAYCLIP